MIGRCDDRPVSQSDSRPPVDQTGEMTFPPPSVSPLRIRGLTKWFGSRRALDGLDLEVPAASCFGLVGPNGSGKSTTLRSVVGLERVDSGEIAVCGIDVTADVRSARSLIGVVLDPIQLFERLTPREFLMTLGTLRGLGDDVVAERSTRLFAALDLTGDADRQIAGFSNGMRKKTALAAAVLHRPRLLLLDEPFEGVDPVSARTMRTMLERFRHGGGTVVLSSHVMDLVERLCDHVAVIHEGRSVASGPTEVLRDGRRLEEAFIDVVGATDVDHDTVAWLG